MFKVKNNDNGTTSLTSLWCLFVNFEHASHLFLVFLFLTLGMLCLLRLPFSCKGNSRVFQKVKVFMLYAKSLKPKLIKDGYLNSAQSVQQMWVVAYTRTVATTLVPTTFNKCQNFVFIHNAKLLDQWHSCETPVYAAHTKIFWHNIFLNK